MALCCLRSEATIWFPVGPDGGDARAFASDPKDHKHLFLGTLTGWIYESHDGGATWAHLSRVGRRDDLVIDNITVDPADARHILAGAWVTDRPDGGLFVSHNAGATWTAVKDMQGQSIRSLAIAPSDPKVIIAGSLVGVFRSTDSGEHWSQISPAGSKEIHEVESLAIDPKDSAVIYAGTWHLPWKTSDGGRSWHTIKQGVIDDSDVFSIIVDPDAPSTVYASACSGIYKSENAGEAFQKVQGIPSTSRRTRVLMQNPKHPEIVFAGTTEGLYRTGDGGASWAPMTGPNVIVNDIYINPDQTDDMLLATDRGGVLESKDGGNTFNPSNRGFTSRQVTSLAEDVRDPAKMYAGVVNDKQWGGVFASKNGGITWEQHGLGLAGKDVFSLVEAPDGSLFAGTNQGIYRWQEDGWVESGAVIEATPKTSSGGRKKPGAAASHTARSGRRSAVSSKRVSSPANKKDLNKKEEPKGTQTTATVFSLAPGIDNLYAATSDGLLRSADSGANWSRLALPEADADVKDWRSLCTMQHALFIASPSRVAISFDDGKNWKMPKLPGNLTGATAIAVDRSGGLWVGGREGLFTSANQGDTWTTIPGFAFNNVNSIFFDAASDRMLVTTGTTMAFSIRLGDKQVRLSDAGWNLRYVRPVGDHLIGATLFDGLVLQPRMVVSPEIKAKPEGVHAEAVP